MDDWLRRDATFRATSVFALTLAVYAANGRTIAALDTRPARILPFAILRDGTFALEGYPSLHRGGRPYYLVDSREHYVSLYPVGAALLALPFYAPAIVAGADPEGPRPEQLEKLASAGIVALAVALLDLALQSITSPARALWITVACALGTASFSTSSQALWQHGPSELALAAALLALVRARAPGREWAAGLAGSPLAFAVVCRPTNVAFAVAFGLYVAVRHRRVLVPFMAGASLPVAFQIAYSLVYFGEPFWNPFPVSSIRWRGQPTQTLAGLLFSPSRGLFVYSPVLIFAVAGMVRALRCGGDALVRAIAAGMLLDLALYARWWEWWGGGSYGPRLLADPSPLLCFAIAPAAALAFRGARPRAVFGVLLAVSVVAHAAGAFWDDGTWNERLKGATRPAALWSWTDNQLVGSLRAAASRTLDFATADPDGEVPDDPAIDLGWQLDDQLELRGVDARVDEPGQLEIVYHWKAVRDLDADYAVFARVDGPGCGDARSDSVLGAPDASSSRWQAGEIHVEGGRLRVPERPEGECAVVVGVWAPSEQRPLRIRDWPTWRKTATAVRLVPSGSGVRVEPPGE